MKTKTKIGMITIVSLAFLLLFTAPSAYAGSFQYNTGSGSYARGYTKNIHQNKFLAANNLEFTAYVKEYEGNKPEICGYRVTIDCFPTVNCWWGDPGPAHYEVDVRAEDAYVDFCSYCKIDVEFWTKGALLCRNQICRKDITWTFEIERAMALPDNGWLVEPDSDVIIFNEDDTHNFTIADFEYYISMGYYYDLEIVPFDMTILGEFTLLPGENESFDLYAGDITGGYVYFHYTMQNATGGVLSEEYAAHEMPPAVGGVWSPVDKLALLAPYIGLASTILVATAATAIYVKHAKRREKKQ